MENTNLPEVLDTPIYCIKCTNFTANKDPVVVKRETHHLNAMCIKCNSKKNKFLKKKQSVNPKKKKIQVQEEDNVSNLESNINNLDSSE